MTAGRATLATTWGLSLLQFLTVLPAAPFIVAEPLSRELLVLTALFLVSSLTLVARRRPRWLVAAHLLAVAMLLVLHPLTEVFGRDGSVVVLMVYSLLALHHLTAAHAETKLLVASLFVGLLLCETALSAFHPPRRGSGVRDYDAVNGPYHTRGFLRPGVDMLVIGEDGPARFVTNTQGFRYRREVSQSKPPGSYRVLFTGDSFVIGYRADQDETVGKRLEDELRRLRGNDSVEVLTAGAGHPEASLRIVEANAAAFQPDVVLVGITLGNDISQSWLTGRKLSAHVLASIFLPRDAFKQGYASLFPVRLHRTLRSWRSYRRLTEALMSDTIAPWYRAYPTHVHLFDAGHSLGHFYSRERLAAVEQSYDFLLRDMAAIDGSARAQGTRAVFALFPQRFQVNEREWRATLFEYGLDPGAFEVDRPNRRLAAECRNAHLDCVDLLPAFREASGQRLYLPLGDMHWNRKGHAVAGKALALALTSRPPA